MEMDLSKPIKEQLFPVNKAVREEIPGTFSPATVMRWGNKGLLGQDGQRIRLQIWMVGRVPHTTRAAIAAFLAEVTAARASRQQSNESTALTATDSELAAAGLLS
jgi:hypothetical protein